MTTVPATILPEPDLIFGQGKKDIDPRIGMTRNGPFHGENEKGPTPTTVRIGIIGTGPTLTLAKEVLTTLARPIASKNTNAWLSPDYPGVNMSTKIRCDFVPGEQWKASITDSDIRALEKIKDVNQRIAACANMYVAKISQILSEDSVPDVIICMLPEYVEEYCGRSKQTRGASIPKPTKLERARQVNRTLTELLQLEDVEQEEKDYDLRNAIKGKAMSLKDAKPIQLLRESSARAFVRLAKGEIEKTNESIQQPAEFAWNLATALYYKANGRPWRVAKLTAGTCYVGIAFFKNKRSATGELQFSMAQVFTHNLEGFVVKGTEVTIDERTREPFMSEKQAHDLLAHAIQKYSERAGGPPHRVVVHKTSRFSDNEKRGVLRAIGKTPSDLVSFRRAPIRFLRMGNYPVLRGTVLSMSTREHLLYTSGYIPRLRTYPGARVPEPLLLTHDGDAEFDHVCREIMGLTKLDWNSTTFSTSTPITIGFAQRVGDVLSELGEGGRIQDHYKFYM
ncbi:MAG: hypothetical protein QOE90_3498 [Thermoplasmata archaeon]|jgi:hypothetical protein|nr:hypothetical protein [Thermoplasmata archaeon]